MGQWKLTSRHRPALASKRKFRLTETSNMPICPVVHTTVLGGALGPSGPRPSKRGSPLLPDSATTDRTDPVGRTETGRAGVFRTGNFRAARGQPDDRTASSQVIVQPGTGV